ncbi:helix-turn-helix domain-containing protein [Methylovorus menthalis]|uniref:helix-turn-helix domain-containing protein n=1 Tax=Methylovorus menthalis TaxID=1002227 RepID=UPI001E37B206|nr:helix-turn-helix transcriptional regulator [Methylovorus menthalis]MCB4810593.1 helix-turn-helix domain-containing protein [Methylovorus menthalis]
MSNSIGKRIKLVRETIGMKREEFSVETGVPIGTLIGIEQGRHEPKAGVLISIANKWPQYAAYLLTDKTDIIQINPE